MAQSTLKRAVLSYRYDVPEALTEYIGKDPTMNLTKMGLRDLGGIRVFRATLAMGWTNAPADKQRLQQLDQFLATLKSQKLITDYYFV